MPHSRGENQHTLSETPWQDEQTLRELYIDLDMTSRELADELGCSKTTIVNWLEKHDIELKPDYGYRTRPNTNPATFFHLNGYEYWQNHYDGEQFAVAVHRLAAVAWFGLEAVRENDLVHHENEVRWDNRESNLMLMDRGEHTSHHHTGVPKS